MSPPRTSKTRLVLPAVALACTALCLALFAPGCGSTAGSDLSDTAAVTDKTSTVIYDEHGRPIGLPLHRRWSERVGQGAQPVGEEAFRNLKALGYTTVLSVDGARPDLVNAGKYGLRYIHIPIGYDGVPREKATQIVQAVKTADGPVYVHCHHGRHRGPTSAMIARIALEGVTNAQAVLDMKLSGTSSKYEGLYADVLAYRPPTQAELDQVGDLPNVVKAAGMVESMVGISQRWEGVKLVKAARWGVPPSNPDIAPAHEATMLWENFRELLRLEESRNLGGEFLELAAETETAAADLQNALRGNDHIAAEEAYDRLDKSCNVCHVVFRD